MRLNLVEFLNYAVDPGGADIDRRAADIESVDLDGGFDPVDLELQDDDFELIGRSSRKLGDPAGRQRGRRRRRQPWRPERRRREPVAERDVCERKPCRAVPSKPAVAVAALALAGAGCGATSQGPFAWLHPQPAPHGWAVARVASGARMPYPPGWRSVRGDAGTATAALLSAGGLYLGYLNVTPRQGGETLSGWPSLRIAHNAAEGNRNVTRLAAARGLRFLTGHGSCVKDAYTTRTGARYIEIACLVAGHTATSVIVGAASPASWPRVSGLIERAISGFRT